MPVTKYWIGPTRSQRLQAFRSGFSFYDHELGRVTSADGSCSVKMFTDVAGLICHRFPGLQSSGVSPMSPLYP
jgi:hypothetical protein